MYTHYFTFFSFFLLTCKGKDPKEAYKKILQDLRKTFPGHILDDQDLEWVFMNAGGWMGSINVLHASLTEYILFFGTAVDTSGHSGL